MSPAMLDVARNKAVRLNLNAAFSIMDGESLEFPDQTFNTVVSTLTLCTFTEPVGALKEMARVCRPDGRILLLEHGRSSSERLGEWQDKGAGRHVKRIGCHWNREPLNLVHEAGLNIMLHHRTFFGMLHVIEAKPFPPGA
jgi:ubiquinone/menaquinone biosynthesis C-methylase UbiE